MRHFALLLTLLFSLPVSASEIVVKIHGEINSDMAEEVKTQVEKATEDKIDHIKVDINSFGGNVQAGQDIIDSLVESKIPTTCEVGNSAFSMAFIILESPACQVREIHPYSILMAHGVGISQLGGNQRGIENLVARIQAINRWAAEVVCARTKEDVQHYIQEVVVESRERWVVGSDAVKANLADKVL